MVYVDWFSVSKEYREKGWGTKLLQESESWALKHKYHYMYLHTESKKNISYYKKRGFRLIGIQKKVLVWRRRVFT